MKKIILLIPVLLISYCNSLSPISFMNTPFNNPNVTTSTLNGIKDSPTTYNIATFENYSWGMSGPNHGGIFALSFGPEDAVPATSLSLRVKNPSQYWTGNNTYVLEVSWDINPGNGYGQLSIPMGSKATLDISSFSTLHIEGRIIDPGSYSQIALQVELSALQIDEGNDQLLINAGEKAPYPAGTDYDFFKADLVSGGDLNPVVLSSSTAMESFDIPLNAANWRQGGFYSGSAAIFADVLQAVTAIKLSGYKGDKVTFELDNLILIK